LLSSGAIYASDLRTIWLPQNLDTESRDGSDAGTVVGTRSQTRVRKEAELRTLQLDGGLSDFKAPLGKILLPQDRNQWPRPEFIRRARALRGI
jgi:hypothetical protein